MSFLRFALIFLVVLLVVRIVRQMISVYRSIPGRQPPPRVDAGPTTPGRGARGVGASPYRVLEVDPQASPREIRAAYQRLIRQYHPDRTASLAPELQQLAEVRTKEINAAYQKLRALGRVDEVPDGR